MLWYKLTQAKKKVSATVSQPKMKINKLLCFYLQVCKLSTTH